MRTFKINWGAGIAGLYLSFVAMIILLVIMSSQQKIDLVTTNYYKEELNFQSKIDKKNASQTLDTPLSWAVGTHDLTMSYPTIFADRLLTGTIHFYCPSDDTKDRKMPLKSSDHKQIIALSELAAGRYKIEIDWQAGSQSFWDEGVIVIDRNTKLKNF
ncbi:FixH family protein [Dyadobacter tibetensis]|uniref:FixH family protein n=1 Tax=Dyadobacter tibetensis TaxID=1211851 RepID=UPI0004724077|nr:FixH family protein [Dyadobacter tibetensis]